MIIMLEQNEENIIMLYCYHFLIDEINKEEENVC
jgi:hypothetical protein